MSFFRDLKLFLWVRYFNIRELVRSAIAFLRHPRFLLLDICLVSSYFFSSPYRMLRRFSKARGIEDNPYGETPLSAFQEVLRRAGVTDADTFVELGSGRGRAAFLSAVVFGMKTIAIEINPDFQNRAKMIAKLFGITNIAFLCEDMADFDFSKGTVFYLYGTTYSERMLRNLANKMRSLKAGTEIISVSFPLQDYVKEPIFQLLDTVYVEFPWGMGEVYIQKRR